MTDVLLSVIGALGIYYGLAIMGFALRGMLDEWTGRAGRRMSAALDPCPANDLMSDEAALVELIDPPKGGDNG